MAAEVQPGKPDPHKPIQVAVVGKKGSGKSELAFLFFDSYPFDRATVDPAGDLKMPEDTYELTTPVPSRWPAERIRRLQAEMGQRPRQQTIRFVPHFHEPDYLEDIDRVVGLAYSHGRTCLFVDECHEAAPAGRTPPHMRRALRQGRHADLTLILATPRPVTVDPLVISQADYVYVFKLPNPNDRKRVAESIGWHPKDFDDAVHTLPPYSYLRYDAANDDLARFPPLPQSALKYHHTAAA